MTEIIERTIGDGAGEAAPAPDELTPYVAPLPAPRPVPVDFDGAYGRFITTATSSNTRTWA